MKVICGLKVKASNTVDKAVDVADTTNKLDELAVAEGRAEGHVMAEEADAKANEANKPDKAVDVSEADEVEATEANEADLANKLDKTDKAEAYEADEAIVTDEIETRVINKAIVAGDADDGATLYSLTKYSAILAEVKGYFGIVGLNNQLEHLV
jgi:hypothetical protein